MFFDLHTHSTRSDGAETPEALIAAAKEAGLHTIALTDHNRLDVSLSQKLSQGIEVIPACEFSAMLALPDGRSREIHIIGLWLEETGPIQSLLQRNQPDRRPYILAYLDALDRLGVDLSPDHSHSAEKALQQLEKENPTYVGRAAIARRMAAMGYVRSQAEAFTEWIGRAPGDRPRVRIPAEDYLHYAPLEEVMAAVRSCPGALTVLCHPFYPTPAGEVEALVRYFARLGGDAMEVYYGSGDNAYTKQQEDTLLRLAEACHLLPSAGSDRHSPSCPFLRRELPVYTRLLHRHLQHI